MSDGNPVPVLPFVIWGSSFFRHSSFVISHFPNSIHMEQRGDPVNLAPLQSKVNAADIAPESLAGNQHLTQSQKISEASRQFEAMLLRQILSETQKPVIQSEFTDNSTAAGIYQDLITNQLSDSLSKSDAIGLAKTFEQQLNRKPEAESLNSEAGSPTSDLRLSSARNSISIFNPKP